MFRFRLITILILIVTVSVAMGWFVDRRRLSNQIKRQNPLIRYYCEKAYLWSPAEFLAKNTDELETQLSDKVDGFTGDFVTSSQGIGHRRLRRPSIETLDAVTRLLDDDSSRIDAAELIALYLESVSGSENQDDASIATMAHFQVHGLPKVQSLINDDNVGMRGAVALILGNTFRSRETEQLLREAFDKETNQEVKLHLSWSYFNITR